MHRTSLGWTMLHQARRRAAARKRRLHDLDQRDEITKRNAIESPLLRLPPEIRNTIYAYIFGNTRYLFNDKCYWTTGHISPTGYQTGYQHPNLPLVCRQLHHETKLLPYKLVEFHFPGWWSCTYDSKRIHEAMRKFLGGRSREEVEALSLLIFRKWAQEGGTAGNGMYWARKLGVEQFRS